MTVAHITGAARGIGKAIALRLAQDGHNVAVSDLPAMRDELEVTRKDVESHGVRAVALTGDVSDHDAVRRLVADTADQLGSLDVMVANAGIAQTKALLSRGRDFARQRWPFGQFRLTRAGGFVGSVGCSATRSACSIRIW